MGKTSCRKKRINKKHIKLIFFDPIIIIILITFCTTRKLLASWIFLCVYDWIRMCQRFTSLPLSTRRRRYLLSIVHRIFIENISPLPCLSSSLKASLFLWYYFFHSSHTFFFLLCLVINFLPSSFTHSVTYLLTSVWLIDLICSECMSRISEWYRKNEV